MRGKVKQLATTLGIMIMGITFTGCGVEQTKDSVTIEAGQELHFSASEYFNVEEDKAKDFTFEFTDVDVNTVGTYEAKAFYKKEEYTIEVIVEDTTAPQVEFKNRVFFTNDATNTDVSAILESIYDASDYITTFVRFEKTENLRLMDDIEMEKLANTIPLPCDEEELKMIGTEEIPTEEGIYRSVLEIKDIYGNAIYEEVYVILDKTGALIEEVPDKTIEVAKENLSDEPQINTADYTINDNVDGKILAENITYELELQDEATHSWLVHVSHTDRSGNESKADFLIHVKEQTGEQIASNNNTQIENNVSQSNNSQIINTQTQNNNQTVNNQTQNNNNQTTNNQSQSNNNQTTNKEPQSNNNQVATNQPQDNNNQKPNNETSNNTQTGTTQKPSNDSGNNTSNNEQTDENNNETTTKPDNSANQNENEWTPTDDEHDISPYEQKVIDAGYGNVVDFGDGTYAVLMKDSDHKINGKRGFEILIEYLAARDLESTNITGGIIDEDNEWHWYIAKDVRELITKEDEEFWD